MSLKQDLQHHGRPSTKLDPQYRNVMSKLIGPSSTEIIGEIQRLDFDPDCLFGSATSAYQFEGAYDEDCSGLSVWDSWTQLHPDRVADGTNGNVAVDQYHLYKDDIQMMKRTGLESYRFSISWPRVMPGGKLDAGVNRKGIEYYHNLIDDLIANGIEPCVTLFHWDLPLALELAYGGFLSEKIVKDFVDYAELCFWEFGDKVKTWITFNEGWTYCYFGYVAGTFPPGHGTTTTTHCAKYDHCAYKGGGILDARLWKGDTNMQQSNDPILARANAFQSYLTKVQTSQCGGAPRHCEKGNAGTEPYIAAHNMILAHAHAVHAYRTKFQVNQGGKIGITNNAHFFEPLNDTDEDRNACIRAIDWMFGWFTAPVTTGDYPPNMRHTCGNRLPKFSAEQKVLVNGSYDFIGINYYTTWYATLALRQPGDPDTYLTDRGVNTFYEKNGVPIGEPTGAEWLYIVPRGIYNILVYAREIYKINLIYITENGCADRLNHALKPSEAKEDPVRVRYYREHLWFLRKAIREAGINVKRYFLWSLGDNFEWADGYTYRFGTFYIDFVNGQLTRTPKTSAIWWRNFFNFYNLIGSKKRDAASASGEFKSDYDLRKRAKPYEASE